MKTFPLFAATAIGMLGIFATQPSYAGSDNGGGLTGASTADHDDDQVNTSSVGDDNEAAENDEAGHKGDGAATGSHEGDQDGDHQGDDHDGDHEVGDGASHDGGGDSGGHDGGGESGGHDGGGGSGDHDGGGDD
ncbi:hypothetical protein [Mesorhizobium argentiipisi]|uniref:Uncharacterized protein n=1 Tax=Mesorhizobium argentiipisi TaxID=3015175 RepID=A0ABU8KIP4_9HYPH